MKKIISLMFITVLTALMMGCAADSQVSTNSALESVEVLSEPAYLDVADNGDGSYDITCIFKTGAKEEIDIKVKAQSGTAEVEIESAANVKTYKGTGIVEETIDFNSGDVLTVTIKPENGGDESVYTINFLMPPTTWFINSPAGAPAATLVDTGDYVYVGSYELDSLGLDVGQWGAGGDEVKLAIVSDAATWANKHVWCDDRSNPTNYTFGFGDDVRDAVVDTGMESAIVSGVGAGDILKVTFDLTKQTIKIEKTN